MIRLLTIVPMSPLDTREDSVAHKKGIEKMKALLINGSPRANGNTARALKEVADTLAAEGVDTETVWIGKKPVRGCVAC